MGIWTQVFCDIHHPSLHRSSRKGAVDDAKEVLSVFGWEDVSFFYFLTDGYGIMCIGDMFKWQAPGSVSLVSNHSARLGMSDMEETSASRGLLRADALSRTKKDAL